MCHNEWQCATVLPLIPLYWANGCTLPFIVAHSVLKPLKVVDYIQDLIEMTLRKMDVDKDGRVSFTDWKATIEAEPLLLEAFGPCLPNVKAGEVFIEKTKEAD